MLSASLAHVRTILALITSGAHYRAIRTQIASITKVFDTACALVATTAFGAKILVAFVAMFAAVFAERRAIRTTSAQAHYRTVVAQKTRIAKTFFKTCALVATSAVFANIVATFRATFSAIRTQFGTVFAMITSGAYYSTARTQQTVDAEIFLAACALHANTAVNTYFFVTFVAMLAASFANQSTVITMVTRGANYSATRTQITIITKIFVTACTLVAHTAVGTDILVTLGTTFSATLAQIGTI